MTKAVGFAAARAMVQWHECEPPSLAVLCRAASPGDLSGFSSQQRRLGPRHSTTASV